MADTFKVKARFHGYRILSLALLYPASWAHRVSLFFQGKAEIIRPAATEAFFATEAGAEFKVKLEEAASKFFAKLQERIEAEGKFTNLPDLPDVGGTD